MGLSGVDLEQESGQKTAKKSGGGGRTRPFVVQLPKQARCVPPSFFAASVLMTSPSR